MVTMSLKNQEGTNTVDVPIPNESPEAIPEPTSIISRLETALSEDVDAIDTLVGDEIAAAMDGAQNREWSEMIKDFTDQVVDEFVVSIKGDDQQSF
jgi:hypothetical protein